MSTMLLVRHPRPHATESLRGYVLRLSEENGYSSPWNLYRLAGMTQSESRGSGIKVAKLARITNQPIAELHAIAYSAATGLPRWARLLRHDLLPIDLNFGTPRLCPPCVRETGFLEAHWELELMVGCPIHQCLALSSCSVCGKPLRWFRPALLKCECGAIIEGEPTTKLSTAEISVLDVIWRKVHRLVPGVDNPVDMPIKQLSAMSLRAILVLIQTLGKYRLIADGFAGDADGRRTLVASSNVIASWPHNFFVLLDDLGKQVDHTNKTSVIQQFQPILNALFKNKTVRSKQDFDFVRHAFVDFGLNHWGQGVVDRRLLRGDLAHPLGRFSTRAALAPRLGVQSRAITRMLKNGAISGRQIASQPGSRVVIDTQGLSATHSQSGTILRVRDAARSLGVSVSLLQCLRKRGIFEIHSLWSAQPGFRSTDVEDFRHRMLSLATGAALPRTCTAKMIEFRNLLRSAADVTSLKADLVAALLSGGLIVIDQSDNTVGGLLLMEADCEEFVRRSRESVCGTITISINQTAKFLCCEAATVAGLVEIGSFYSVQTSAGLRIAERCVVDFGRKYCSLASVARLWKTSSRALIALSDKGAVALLWAPIANSRSPQPFILRSDIARLAKIRSVERPNAFEAPGVSL